MVQAGTEAHTPSLREFFFLRHGARLDQLDYNWRLTSPTPYDTPITRVGSQQAKLAGQAISQHSQYAPITSSEPRRARTPARSKSRFIIHSSPFLRCIQTSLALASTLAATTKIRPLLRLDCFLGEWMTPDYYEDIQAPPSMPELAMHARYYLKQCSSSPPSSPPDESLHRRFQSLHLGPDDKLPVQSEEAVVDAETVQVDWKWDANRFGSGGEYGEEWPEMHKRFRSSLRALLDYYSHATSLPDEQDPIVIMVTHGAGCNAMIGAVSGRPVLKDVPIASISHAILRNSEQCSTHERSGKSRLSDDYCLLMSASIEHLYVPEPPANYGAAIGRSGSWHNNNNTSRSSSLSISSSRGLWSSPKHSRRPSDDTTINQIMTPQKVPIIASPILELESAPSYTISDITTTKESPRELVIRRGRQRSFTIQN